MKLMRFLFAITMIVSCFGIAIIDFRTPGAHWKAPALGIIYGIANIIIFVFKD